MNRYFSLLLCVLLLAGCASTSGSVSENGQSSSAQDSSQSADHTTASGKTASGKTASGSGNSQSTDKLLHACSLTGTDATREDIRIYGSSEEAPFTKVELIEYLPCDFDFQNADEEDAKHYLETVKDNQVKADGIDPSMLKVGWEDNDIALTYICRDLKELQHFHPEFSQDTVSSVFKNAAAMQGVTACDQEPVENRIYPTLRLPGAFLFPR